MCSVALLYSFICFPCVHFRSNTVMFAVFVKAHISKHRQLSAQRTPTHTLLYNRMDNDIITSAKSPKWWWFLFRFGPEWNEFRFIFPNRHFYFVYVFFFFLCSLPLLFFFSSCMVTCQNPSNIRFSSVPVGKKHFFRSRRLKNINK